MSRPRRTIPKLPRVEKPVWTSNAACPACGKKIYKTKKAARRAAKIHHPHVSLSTYQCRSKSPLRPDPAPWHYGHLDEEIKHGNLDRNDRYEWGQLVPDDEECTFRGKSGLKCSLSPTHDPKPHLAQTMSGDWINISSEE
jgi:hypothetical protein